MVCLGCFLKSTKGIVYTSKRYHVHVCERWYHVHVCERWYHVHVCVFSPEPGMTISLIETEQIMSESGGGFGVCIIATGADRIRAIATLVITDNTTTAGEGIYCH